jgi:DNA mismatch repair protein MutL
VGTSNIFTIINGRPARAKPLFKAVAGAYDGRLERGRYPMAVVYLTLPLDAVDVNVHPRKEEVRLAEENAVYEFVSGALRRALAGVVVAVPASSFAPSPVSAAALAPEKAGGPADAATRGAVAAVRDAVEGYLKSRSLWPERRGDGAAPFTEVGGAPLVAGPGKPLAADAATVVLGQLDDTYIIVRRCGDLVVFDQHTAHERVLYERLERAAGDIPRQELLLPATVTLSRAAAADLRVCLPALAEAGFDVAEFGADTFILRGHPADLAVGDAEGLFAQLVKDFAEAGRPAAADDRRDTVRKSVACRAAVKAGQPLAASEMAALVSGLLRARRPEVCPHGRPTMVHLSSRELAKLFGR